ncbi:MAG: transcriptional repressor LexA [Planctomycetota bacterium]
MDALTDCQRDVLAWIARVLRERGVPPSMRDIGRHFRYKSVATVRDHLDAIVRKGFLEKTPGIHRGMRLTGAGIAAIGDGRPGKAAPIPLAAEPSVRYRETPERLLPEADAARVRAIPVLGRIAAGTPLLAEENLEGVLAVDESLLPRSGESFFLQVRGDSMTGEGIFDGDLALIRKCDTVESGSIAAVLVDGEATLKRFLARGRKIILEAANPAYSPIVLTAPADVKIIGRLGGIVRKY